MAMALPSSSQNKLQKSSSLFSTAILSLADFLFLRLSAAFSLTSSSSSVLSVSPSSMSLSLSRLSSSTPAPGNEILKSYQSDAMFMNETRKTVCIHLFREIFLQQIMSQRHTEIMSEIYTQIMSERYTQIKSVRYTQTMSERYLDYIRDMFWGQKVRLGLLQSGEIAIGLLGQIDRLYEQGGRLHCQKSRFLGLRGQLFIWSDIFKFKNIDIYLRILYFRDFQTFLEVTRTVCR